MMRHACAQSKDRPNQTRLSEKVQAEQIMDAIQHADYSPTPTGLPPPPRQVRFRKWQALNAWGMRIYSVFATAIGVAAAFLILRHFWIPLIQFRYKGSFVLLLLLTALAVLWNGMAIVTLLSAWFLPSTQRRVCQLGQPVPGTVTRKYRGGGKDGGYYIDVSYTDPIDNMIRTTTDLLDYRYPSNQVQVGSQFTVLSLGGGECCVYELSYWEVVDT